MMAKQSTRTAAGIRAMLVNKQHLFNSIAASGSFSSNSHNQIIIVINNSDQTQHRLFSTMNSTCRDEEKRQPIYTNKKRMQAVLDEMGEKYKNVYNEDEPLVKPRFLRASTLMKFFGSNVNNTTNYFWKNNGMLIIAVILVVGVLLMVDAAMKPVNIPKNSKFKLDEMEREARSDLYSQVKGKMKQ